MTTLDLRNIRCPLALIKLKQFLINIKEDIDCEIIFSNDRSMQDIIRYLEAKQFNYKKSSSNSIFIILS